MTQLTGDQILAIDHDHIWHPYSSVSTPTGTTKASKVYPVASANGCIITLKDGTELIDGMSSWWSAIHGYNNATLNAAATAQLNSMAHIMFGGLTHEPAALLVKKLVQLTPDGLNKVFLSDSGSVAVEVALKMAVQYWLSQGQPQKSQFISLRSGYHGDTLGAMSVCDPVTGMHHLFSHLLPKNIFVESPACGFNQPCTQQDIQPLLEALQAHHAHTAAIILEPIVQGAGGMRMYSPEYLKQVRALCDEYNVLLIADEIATGFGRTGKLFACEHAQITPDILCLGKALTGGYLTLAATLCTHKVAEGICEGEAGVFMHGPTFMGNPLACAIANASIDLLLNSQWQQTVYNIEQQLQNALKPCTELSNVKEVRVLGAIGVVELHAPVDFNAIVDEFVRNGVWIRPFGKLVYIMPPFIISKSQLEALTNALFNVVKNHS